MLKVQGHSRAGAVCFPGPPVLPRRRSGSHSVRHHQRGLLPQGQALGVGAAEKRRQQHRCLPSASPSLACSHRAAENNGQQHRCLTSLTTYLHILNCSRCESELQRHAGRPPPWQKPRCLTALMLHVAYSAPHAHALGVRAAEQCWPHQACWPSISAGLQHMQERPACDSWSGAQSWCWWATNLTWWRIGR